MDFLTPGYEDMELSTQLLIKEALARGARVEVLDRADNFILVEKGGRREYVKQATRTGADSYVVRPRHGEQGSRQDRPRPSGHQGPGGESCASTRPRPWRRRGLRGPRARHKAPVDQLRRGRVPARPRMDEGRGRGGHQGRPGPRLRRHPRGLRAGPGIPLPRHRGKDQGGPSPRSGQRRRRRRLDHRAAWSSSKNGHPNRGEGYHSPLERLRLGEVELAFLAEAGLGADSVVEAGRRVFLRRNSNISTGGDSMDFTDEMPEIYKRVAERAAEAVGARVSGVDMIVPDVSDGSAGAAYTVIELNYNPALHIHDFPAEGKNRRVERFLLDLIGIEGGIDS